MNRSLTTTIQEVRRDPVSFLRQINRGKTITVIYHSKPFSVVRSAKELSTQSEQPTNMQRMLEYAELARNSAKHPLDANLDYKSAYDQDMAQKYDIS